MAVMNNKKGFFFTIIALIIVSLLFMFFLGRGNLLQKSLMPVEENRIKVVNNYVKNAEEIYIKRMLIASSYKAIDFAISDYKTNKVPKNLNWFSDRMINGMGKYSLSKRLELLEKATSEMLHLNASFKPIKAELYQDKETGPWRVGVNLTIVVTVDGIIAKWNKTTVIEALLNVEGMNDPLIKYNTAKDPWLIWKTRFEGNWTPNNAHDHFFDQAYKHEQRAPSYLKRLMNSTSNSTCCGIEILIDFSSLGVQPKNVSSIAYCYWNPVSCIEQGYGQFIWEVDGITDAGFSNFRLDTYHAEQYNVTTGNSCEYSGGAFPSWNGNGCIGGAVAAAQKTVCGNNKVEFGEQCDDGNTVSGDGCSATCQTETPQAICGNSIIETGEQCDDGNIVSGDGCSATCQTEAPQAICGNSIIETGEQCDDGNIVSGDGCSATCQTEAPPAGPPAHCSSGSWDGDESDQDCGGSCSSCAATLSCWAGSDCVSGSCAISPITFPVFDLSTGTPYNSIAQLQALAGQSWIIPYQGKCQTAAVCGNGQTETGEQCDDGNSVTETCNYGQTSCAVCDSICQNVGGATSYCGDNIVDTGNGEQCELPSTGTCDSVCKTITGPPAHCSNSAWDGDESDQDCGGSCAACQSYLQPGAVYVFCFTNSDCPVSCDLTQAQNPFPVPPGLVTTCGTYSSLSASRAIVATTCKNSVIPYQGKCL